MIHFIWKFSSSVLEGKGNILAVAWKQWQAGAAEETAILTVTLHAKYKSNAQLAMHKVENNQVTSIHPVASLWKKVNWYHPSSTAIESSRLDQWSSTWVVLVGQMTHSQGSLRASENMNIYITTRNSSKISYKVGMTILWLGVTTSWASILNKGLQCLEGWEPPSYKVYTILKHLLSPGFDVLAH